MIQNSLKTWHQLNIGGVDLPYQVNLHQDQRTLRHHKHQCPLEQQAASSQFHKPCPLYPFWPVRMHILNHLIRYCIAKKYRVQTGTVLLSVEDNIIRLALSSSQTMEWGKKGQSCLKSQRVQKLLNATRYRALLVQLTPGKQLAMSQ